jgi:hypothetical protein
MTKEVNLQTAKVASNIPALLCEVAIEHLHFRYSWLAELMLDCILKHNTLVPFIGELAQVQLESELHADRQIAHLQSHRPADQDVGAQHIEKASSHFPPEDATGS